MRELPGRWSRRRDCLKSLHGAHRAALVIANGVGDVGARGQPEPVLAGAAGLAVEIAQIGLYASAVSTYIEAGRGRSSRRADSRQPRLACINKRENPRHTVEKQNGRRSHPHDRDRVRGNRAGHAAAMS